MLVFGRFWLFLTLTVFFFAHLNHLDLVRINDENLVEISHPRTMTHSPQGRAVSSYLDDSCLAWHFFQGWKVGSEQQIARKKTHMIYNLYIYILIYEKTNESSIFSGTSFASFVCLWWEWFLLLSATKGNPHGLLGSLFPKWPGCPTGYLSLNKQGSFVPENSSTPSIEKCQDVCCWFRLIGRVYCSMKKPLLIFDEISGNI